MPDFLSPFRWQLVAQLSNAYERRELDLWQPPVRDDRGAQLLSVRYPNQWTPAVEQAAQSEIGRVYLGFSRFPAARSTLDADGTATVRWSDMRFIMNRVGTSERQSGLFIATVRVGADGRPFDQRLGR